MSDIFKHFTHIDDLRNSEPEYFQRRDAVTLDLERPDLSLTRNPLMVLEEGAKKMYNESPIFVCQEEGHPSDVLFIMQCRLRDLSGEGKAKTKKFAKQIAAAEVLKQGIHKKDSHFLKYMGIPGKTIEDYLEYIQTILGNVTDNKITPAETASDYDRSKNYVGAVHEICQKHKLAEASYEPTEDGPQHDITYTVTCKIDNRETKGKSKKKKDAKHYAAYLMMKELETGFQDMENNLNTFADDDECVSEEDAARSLSENPVQSVNEILEDKSKFSSYKKDYRILDNPCSFGLTQCLLKVVCVKVNDNTENTFVFNGLGTNEDASRKDADLNALKLLETF